MSVSDIKTDNRNLIREILVLFKELGAGFVEIDKSLLDKKIKNKKSNYNISRNETEIIKNTEEKKHETPDNSKYVKNSETLDDIRKEVINCQSCNLSQKKKNYVFGEGSKKPDILFIGEGPGEQEDNTGKPFVGDAGQLLEKIINRMGYKRDDVYIANIVKCRPPKNRTPTLQEAKTCLPYLIRQIEVLKPKVIVCLGKTATNYLLDKELFITRVRGTEFEFKGIPVIPTFHPSYILHQRTKENISKAKWQVWSDMETVLNILKR